MGVVGAAIKGFGKALKRNKEVAKKVAPIAAAMVGSSAAGYHAGKKSKTHVPEEIKALVTGTRKVSKNQKKFKK